MIVSKKAGNSPFRNRVRRVIKEVYSFFPMASYDIIILYRKGTVFYFSNFKKDYLKLWRKVNI